MAAVRARTMQARPESKIRGAGRPFAATRSAPERKGQRENRVRKANQLKEARERVAAIWGGCEMVQHVPALLMKQVTTRAARAPESRAEVRARKECDRNRDPEVCAATYASVFGSSNIFEAKGRSHEVKLMSASPTISVPPSSGYKAQTRLPRRHRF